MNNRFCTLKAVLAAVRGGELGTCNENGTSNDFNVYWKHDGTPQLNDEIYVGSSEAVSDDVPDEDYDYALLPQAVKDRDWWLSYSGDLVEDVVSNVLTQKPDASDRELLVAIEYYSEHDVFLEFN
jgi:hypothetical protein